MGRIRLYLYPCQGDSADTNQAHFNHCFVAQMLVNECVRTGMHWSHCGYEMQRVTYEMKIAVHSRRACFYFQYIKVSHVMCDFFPPGSYSFLQQQTHVEALCIAGGINIHVREASFFESKRKKQPKGKKKKDFLELLPCRIMVCCCL